MKVGLALNAFDTGSGSDAADLAGHVELAVIGAELGLDSVFVFEHHCTSYIVSPSPLLLLGWLAPQLPGVVLGTSVVMLPAYNRRRLAEDVCLLDNLSGGRLLLGVGAGRSRKEVALFRDATLPTSLEFAQAVNELFVLIDDATAGDPDGLRPRPAYGPQNRIYVASSSAVINSRTGHRFPRMSNFTSEREITAGITFATITMASTVSRARELAERDSITDLAMMRAHYGPKTVTASSPNVDGQLFGDVATMRSMLCDLNNRGVEHLVLEFAFGGRDLPLARDMLVQFCDEVLPSVRNEPT